MDPRPFLIVPIFGLLMLSLGTQLIDVAQSASDKTVSFASDMEQAMECAMDGIPLENCSPDIYNHDFDDEIKESQEIGETVIRDYSELLNQIEGIDTGYQLELVELDNGETYIIVHLNES